MHAFFSGSFPGQLYAANEALKLEYGGISYIANVLQCDRKTIYRGITELTHPEMIEKDRERAKVETRVRIIDLLKSETAGCQKDFRIAWHHACCRVAAFKNIKTSRLCSK